MAGTVAALHPTRTIIASEQEKGGAPSAIFINNAEIVESYIIENLSRAAPSTASYEPSADGALAL